MIAIEPGDPFQPETAMLLQQSQELMESLFPSEDNHYLSLEELAAPEVCFFVARLDGKPVGTGALAAKEGYGEVKSMFVDRAARGQGIADALLRRLEQCARDLGLPVLRLETGNSLNAALRLYGRHGFEMCGPFGDYAESATSLFLEKKL